MATTRHSTLAIFGGEPVRDPEKPWPAWPVFDGAERRALNDVLESGQWWYGERVRAFEDAFAHYQGARYCISCVNGTVAAEIVLQALGIGPGDEVIVPPFTFFATASSVSRMGAKPVFVDVDESWNLDPERIEAAVTPRTRAIMPVHFGGRVCDMDRLNEIAAPLGLHLIEDACHSWGAKWNGRGTGTLGSAGVFSFQASKNMTAGEGGAIVTDNPELAEICRSLTHSGRKPDAPWFEHYALGTNARITEFAAAILHAQMQRLDEHHEVRARNAAILDDALDVLPGTTVQPGDARITRRMYHIYCLRIEPERVGCSRDRFVEAAIAEGLPVGKGYPLPLYRQPVYADEYVNVSCPVCEDLCFRSAVWMNHRVLLGSESDMKDAVAIFNKVYENAAELAQNP